MRMEGKVVREQRKLLAGFRLHSEAQQGHWPGNPPGFWRLRWRVEHLTFGPVPYTSGTLIVSGDGIASILDDLEEYYSDCLTESPDFPPPNPYSFP